MPGKAHRAEAGIGQARLDRLDRLDRRVSGNGVRLVGTRPPDVPGAGFARQVEQCVDRATAPQHQLRPDALQAVSRVPNRRAPPPFGRGPIGLCDLVESLSTYPFRGPRHDRLRDQAQGWTSKLMVGQSARAVAVGRKQVLVAPGLGRRPWRASHIRSPSHPHGGKLQGGPAPRSCDGKSVSGQWLRPLDQGAGKHGSAQTCRVIRLRTRWGSLNNAVNCSAGSTS